MPNVLFIGSFPEEKLKNLPFIILQASIPEAVELGASFINKLEEAEVLISRSGCKFTVSLLEKAPKLKLLIKAGAGVDMIDKEYCANRKIKILNVPGGNKEAVAEIGIGLALSLARNITHADRDTRNGNWNKDSFVGEELYGAFVSVIGFGNIGKRTAELLRVFGCQITVYDPTMTTEEKDNALRSGYHVEDCLNCVVKKARFIFLHPSLSITSKGMFNEEIFKKMQKMPYIINLSRASVVDEKALLDAFKNKQISGAAIDVWWEEPIKNNPFHDYNVIMTPHIGGSTKESLDKITDGVISQVINFFNLNEQK